MNPRTVAAAPRQGGAFDAYGLFALATQEAELAGRSFVAAAQYWQALGAAMLEMQAELASACGRLYECGPFLEAAASVDRGLDQVAGR